METFKIEHFEKENPELQFPHYEQLEPEECHLLLKILAQKVGLSVDANGLSLVNRVAEIALPISNVDANADSFDLARALAQTRITPQEHVYVNWYRYDNIDRLKFVELTEHFADVWYPSVDDIDIFDDTFQWVLSVTHDGRLQLTSLR